MRANVEGASYRHECYATGDLHMDANGLGIPYDEEKTLDGQLSYGFLTKEANGYSGYDNEMFKRTILAHEAIFRQQVYQLHRVYRIQRTMMKQHQNQEIHVYPMLEDVQQTNSPTRVSPDGAKMIEQTQMPLSSIPYRKATVAVNNDINYSLKFLREGTAQSSPNGCPLTDVALHNKQGTFDLQLPADYSVDNENESDNKPIDFLGVPSATKHQNFGDLTVVKDEGLGRFADNCSTSVLPTGANLLRQQVANLSELTAGMYTSRTNGSISRGPSYTLDNNSAPDNRPVNFLGVSSDTKHQNFPNFTAKAEGLGRFIDNSSTSGLTIENNLGRQRVVDLNEPIFGMYMGRTNGSVSKDTSHTLEKSRHQSVMGPSTTNFMFNKDYSKDKHTDEGTSFDFFDSSSRIRQDEKPLINKGKQVSNLNFFAPRCSDVVPKNPFEAADQRFVSSNQLNYLCPNGSGGWFSKSHLEASVINNFARVNHPHHSSPITHVARISFPHIDHLSTGSTIEQSARQYHEHPDFASGTGTKNFNLNEAILDDQEDVPVEQHAGCVGSLQHSKGEGSTSGIQCPRKEASCTGLTPLEDPRKVFEHSYGTVREMKDNTGMMETAMTPCNLLDSALTSVSCGINKDKAPDDITTGTQLACNKTPENSSLPPPCQKFVPRHERAAEGVINKCGAPTWNFIDLNEDAPNEDDSESSVVSHECHVSSLQNNNAKRTFVVDLQEPACGDFAAWTSHQDCPPSGEPDVFVEGDTYFDSATAAAKDIIALSMEVRATADTSDDMLHWFAELAVSSTDGHAGQVEVQGCINSSSDDDLNSFVSLTLKLEETKFDKYLSKPLAPAIANDEQAVSTINLTTKPKRGQQRKRRHKQDFQKDILPSISSLSRPEIIEDIQLLEGLVQTTGGSWESSFTKRRRNGGRSRGRKPKKQLLVIAEEEVQVSPPSKPDSAGLEAEDRGIMGWGRTTRRCRRPRCTPGNIVAAAS